MLDTYVAENPGVAVGKMQEERISENIINQRNDAVKNVTDNPIILSAITEVKYNHSLVISNFRSRELF